VIQVTREIDQPHQVPSTGAVRATNAAPQIGIDVANVPYGRDRTTTP
jgi:hypothetical protein